MAKGRQPILAREGWAHIAISGMAAALVHYAMGWLWALPLWVAFILVVI